MIRKAATGKLPGTLTYVLSDNTRDRYGDIIEASGWQLDNFRANPIALFSHQGSFPVGTWANVRVEGGKLIGDYMPADSGTSARIDEINSLVRQNVLKTTSVGFNPIESVPIDPAKPYDGIRYTRQELLETSIVSVPANPAAVQLARSLNISDDTMSLVFGVNAVSRRRDMPTGVQADRQSLRSRATPMTTMEIQTPVSRQIEDRQSMLNAARDALADLVRDPNHDGAEEDLLNEEIEEHDLALKRLQRSERSLAFRVSADPAPAAGLAAPASARRPFGLPVKERKPIDLYFGMLATRVRAAVTHQPVEDLLRQHYPDDEGTAIVTRAAISGATTTGVGWAVDLVQLAQGDFVNLLYPTSVFPKLSAMGTALNFGPNAGAIKIPSRTATPSIGGAFVAEAQPIPVRRFGTSSITLYPHKVGGISVYSREIAAYSNPAIEALIRDSIVNDTSINIDGVLLDATAVSTTRPAGLTNGVVALTATAGGGYAAFLGDLNKLTAPFYAANAGRKLALLMNPQQRQQLVYAPGPAGAPFGWATQFEDMFTVVASTSIAAGSAYMVDAVDFVSVADAPEFVISEEATLHMEDTTPLQIGTPGSPAVVAAPVQSMYQTAQIAIRMTANVSWAMRRAGMVQFIASGINWGP
jgi:HK97 family phage prohead protease/HK97 family phage major capsid protein